MSETTNTSNVQTLEEATKVSVVSKMLGIHPQKQDGLYMQRIKIFAGRITWRQWCKIAQLAAAYSPGTPIHLTTRQDIELHNIPGGNIPDVQRGLAEEGISVFAAGGDSIRNITVSTDSELQADGFDLVPLAQLVRQYLEQHPVALSLHRKFKISFSASQRADTKPWLNDLGFIAQGDGQFTVICAGSLGPKPALGIELYRNLPAKEVLPLCLAAAMFFAEHGERENRRRARFRHVREKFGDREFEAELERRFEELRALQPWPSICPARADRNIKQLARLQLPNGNISAQQAVKLADIAEPKGATLRINLEHGLELYGTEALELSDDLAAFTKNPVIVACPGSSTCVRALVNGWATADKIREKLAGEKNGGVRINISGCPNNCAHSTVADIGLVGILRKQEGKLVECYRLYAGGGNGTNDKLARELEIISAGDVPAKIEQLIKIRNAAKKPDK